MSDLDYSVQGEVRDALDHARLVSDFRKQELINRVIAAVESRIVPDPVGFVSMNWVNAMLREIAQDINRLPFP